MSETDLYRTPEQYRQRYLELKSRAQETNARRPSGRHAANPPVLSRDLVVEEETIPVGWYWTRMIARGRSLRIVNDHATAGVSAFFWNAADTSERYNAGDTVKVQWSARLSRGRVLLSDMGRVMASITDDTCGAHDFIVGGSTRSGDRRKYGSMARENPDGRNTRENFVLAAGKHGLGSRDVGPCITFFAPVATDEQGGFVWQGGAVKRSDYVDLRAEMDLIVALSNCPHPLSPDEIWRAQPVRAIVWRSATPAADDLCRTATDEAVRAFENTAAMFVG